MEKINKIYPVDLRKAEDYLPFYLKYILTFSEKFRFLSSIGQDKLIYKFREKEDILYL